MSGAPGTIGAHVPTHSTPINKVIKDYDLWTDRPGVSYGTVIIDKSGTVRLHHNSVDGANRTSVAEIQRVLREIK